MYIKEIVIQGFKSFKDQVAVEPFSPHHNVVVGRNGSGKSNFFFAIQFVLSDSYTRPDERQALLHEGAGVAVMSAFVEIKFDNSEGRFPIDKDEVVLRRTIGLKKDDFFLDNKHITKSEVNNLLETAGFSRSNPYYIVRQGKVNSLAMMKDHERLELLKEVAGTRVYDERKEESIKIMEETDGQLEKIKEVLVYINERLDELQAEKDELREYQLLDRQRRSLEYTIYDNDLKSTLAKLEEIESKRREEGEEARELHSVVVEAQERMRAAERRAAELTAAIESLTREREEAVEERQDALKQRARIELEVADAEERVGEETSTRGRVERELADVEKRIKKAEKELATIEPEFERVSAEESALKSRLEEAKVSLEALFAKQGRTAQFTTVEERDEWIRSELADIEETLTTSQTQLRMAEEMVEGLSEEAELKERELAALNANIEERKAVIEAKTAEHSAKKKERDELQAQRKQCWKKDAEMDKKMAAVNTEIERNERALQTSMSRIMFTGLTSVRRIAAEHNIDGVLGPLIELFEVDDPFTTCVEVTAATGLFNIVVDTDETAARILEVMNKEKSGRVTFMPLNRLSVREHNLPENEDVIPLISKLRFHESVAKAMSHVFGRTLICRNLTVAAAYAKSHNVNCITLEGDQVNRKGALTGGFIDKRTSRLSAMQAIKSCRADLDAMDEEAKKAHTAAVEIEQAVTVVLGELEVIQTDIDKTRQAYEQERLDVRAVSRDLERLRASAAQKEENAADLRAHIKSLQDKAKPLRAELGTPLESQLNSQDQAEVAALSSEISDLQSRVLATSEQRTELEEKFTTLKTTLSENLTKRREELQDKIEDMNIAHRSQALEGYSRDLEVIEETINTGAETLKTLAAAIEEKQTELDSVNAVLDGLRNDENTQTRQLQGESKKMEAILNKRSVLIRKKEEAMRKIRELGSLPAEAFSEYSELSPTELGAALKKCNTELKKYSHVNKKALDQWVTFSEQRESLRKRKEELDRNGEQIRELIRALDMRKDEAIALTFKGVSEAFTDVFSELVPAGNASLVMLHPGATEADEVADGASLESYTGVAMEVSFDGQVTYLMHQLSGGQKSLVALALIFAIQRTMAGGVADAPDPAPFYLFDEIDSALDAAHRTAVANLVHRQSAHAQFITTTFRPEFLANADKYYLVAYDKAAKVSHVESIDREFATSFILDSMREEGL